MNKSNRILKYIQTTWKKARKNKKKEKKKQDKTENKK